MTLSVSRISMRSHSAVAFRALALAGTALVMVVGTTAELAAAPPRWGFDTPVVAYALGFTAVGALVWIRRAPLTAAAVCLAVVLAGHFLSFPGGAAGMVFFYATFELARSGRHVHTGMAFVLPFLWAAALILPPGAPCRSAHRDFLGPSPGCFG